VAAPVAAVPNAAVPVAPAKATAPPAVARPKPAAAPPPVAQQAPAARPPPAAQMLDLASLEQRLRDTRGIGLFTKLSLKNQVDDLLEQFRAYYRAQGKPPPTPLRQRYDGLLLKVITLLQDNDAALAADISSSREALWGILADPARLSRI
jgi:hypothetical protein